MSIPTIEKWTLITVSLSLVVTVVFMSFWIAMYIAWFDKRISLVEQRQVIIERDMRELKENTQKILNILLTQ